MEDLRQYVRRAGKFLPEKIEMVQYEGRTARESKLLFIEFKRDTDRARLAADVEIKVIVYTHLVLNAPMAFSSDSFVFVLYTLHLHFLILKSLFPSFLLYVQLRGMYFDKIERSEVTKLLDGIYQNVHLLEDVQFLVQYAPQVLPPTVQEASGERIWANILGLQEDLTNKREVHFLFCFLCKIFSDSICSKL